MSDQTPLLEIRGARKEFPGVVALSDVSLTLNHGEVLALVGENGAGKSTLMKLLSGIYEPDAGEFFLGGSPLHVSGPKHALELGISIIHQEFNLAADLTIAQNIFLGREPRTAGFFLSERALNAKAQELFDRLGITLNPRQLVGELTVARQQMVEIAKALSYNARVLIMDEPTAALDDSEVDTLFGLIERFTTAETGVIYISHRMDELRRISNRISVLRDGAYVGTLDTAAATVPEVISLMVGREITGETRPELPATRGPVLLEVDGLATATLLRDVSFDLHRGEILGFAGLMGAGRTEVARAIVGADPRSSGTIRIAGTAVNVTSPTVAAAHGIGYLSEDRKRLGVLLERDVAENIVLGSLPEYSRAGVVDGARVQALAREHIDGLRIKTPSMTQLVRYLSGGNQQKVVIAKWLAKDCDVLIFDEPTRGIDIGAKEEIYALLERLAAAGKGIIMISSELPEVLRLAHRIVVMCEGEVTAILDNADADQETLMKFATRSGAEGEVRA